MMENREVKLGGGRIARPWRWVTLHVEARRPYEMTQRRRRLKRDKTSVCVLGLNGQKDGRRCGGHMGGIVRGGVRRPGRAQEDDVKEPGSTMWSRN